MNYTFKTKILTLFSAKIEDYITSDKQAYETTLWICEILDNKNIKYHKNFAVDLLKEFEGLDKTDSYRLDEENFYDVIHDTRKNSPLSELKFTEDFYYINPLFIQKIIKGVYNG